MKIVFWRTKYFQKTIFTSNLRSSKRVFLIIFFLILDGAKDEAKKVAAEAQKMADEVQKAADEAQKAKFE